MNYSKIFKPVLTILSVLSISVSYGQKDTTKNGVDIISSFKPVLKESAKINFMAAPPELDTTKKKLTYDIPNQNLLFAYQPGTLKPLALDIDTGGIFDNNNYVKLGFGNLKTPYVEAGFSLGDGKTAGLNIYAKHVSSDGKRDFQNFTKTDVKLNGYFKTGNTQFDAGIGVSQRKTYKYGYEPASLIFVNDSLKQQFQNISGRFAFHNINKTEFGLTYWPEIKVDIFSDQFKNSESNSVINLPLQKTAGKIFAVNLGATVDFTRFSPKSKPVINNTIYYLTPSVQVKTQKFYAELGIRPSWDNKKFKMFPNVLAEISTGDQRFTFQAGWSGYIRKTTYKYLANENPWLYLPENLTNTWIEERYAGFKGTVGDHFSYAAKAGFNKLNNQPLFVNDYTPGKGGKSFNIVYEPSMNVVNIGGQLGYNIGEKFSLLAGLQLNQFTGLTVNEKAWGLIPMELDANMRVQVIKDLWLKTDLFAWGGPQYKKSDGTAGALMGAADLNAGLEFRITKNLNLWAQFNNVFNNQYQRWNQYPSYGFNFAGGIVFNFTQKNK